MRFGKYELGDLIARGGMAEVWSACLHGAEGFVKPVAIKRIREHISSDPEFVRLFIAEARLVAQLHHGNIVQIHDFDVVEGSYYLAMERVEGRDLRRVLTRAAEQGRRLPPELGLYVAAEVAKGLMAAHERCDDEGRPLGIVHRDLSPHNILLSYEGEVKVTDFGIAKAMAASLGQDTGSDVIRGKVPYMSPEQVRGEALDQRSDLFALGLILFELTTGHRRYAPDARGGEAGLVGQVSEAALPNPAQLNAAISPDLNALIRRLLAPRLAERLGSAREAVQALRSSGARDRSLELASFMQTLYPREAQAARCSPAMAGSSGAQAPSAVQTPGARVAGGRAAVEPSDATGLAAAATVAPGSGGRMFSWLGAAAAVLLIALAAVWASERFSHGRHPEPSQRARGSPVSAARAVGPAHDAAVTVEPGPASPSRREAGALEIDSVPAGASVMVDGLPTGRRAPTRLGVTPGRHRVLVRWEDGVEAEEEKVVRAGERVSLRLTRSVARVAQRPDRTSVSGQSASSVSGQSASSASGQSASSASGQSASSASIHAAGQGSVRFTCLPWALVSIGNDSLGQTPVGRALAPGQYRVTFHNPSLGQKKTIAFRVREGGSPTLVDCDFGLR